MSNWTELRNRISAKNHEIMRKLRVSFERCAVLEIFVKVRWQGGAVGRKHREWGAYAKCTGERYESSPPCEGSFFYMVLYLQEVSSL